MDEISHEIDLNNNYISHNTSYNTTDLNEIIDKSIIFVPNNEIDDDIVQYMNINLESNIDRDTYEKIMEIFTKNPTLFLKYFRYENKCINYYKLANLFFLHGLYSNVSIDSNILQSLYEIINSDDFLHIISRYVDNIFYTYRIIESIRLDTFIYIIISQSESISVFCDDIEEEFYNYHYSDNSDTDTELDMDSSDLQLIDQLFLNIMKN